MQCPIGTDVRRAAAILRGGGLVAFATETVYGLGADALNPAAVARVFEVKNRPQFDPLIVHIADASWWRRLVAEIPEAARRAAQRFWPGPLSIVLAKTPLVPDLVTAGLSTVAVRMPDHPLALELLHSAGRPIAAPSANPFGQISPTRAEHVQEQLGEQIDYILDGGPCRVGLESTVLDFGGAVPRLLRPGGVTIEQLTAELGPMLLADEAPSSQDVPQPSPGLLSRHYAPQTPLRVVDVAARPAPGQRVGLLTLRPPADSSGFAAVEVLSASGDLREAAVNFFAALRRLDALELDWIVALPFPEEHLGRALNDRLRRAAAAA